MHTDLEKSIARRLRAAGDESNEAPYDWAEFQRRRQRSMLTRVIEHNRPAAIAAAVLAAVLVTAVPFVYSSHGRGRTTVTAPPDTVARTNASTNPGDRQVQDRARTRAIESWLAGLPQNHVLMRVGTHAAVSSLQDQIAALDDLMSTERAAGAQPSRLDSLEQQRGQLVSSLAQLQYAEMLASANP
jgi:hypothetical protein